MKFFAVVFALLVQVAHASGQWDVGANSRQRNEALRVNNVVSGVVLQVRNVRLAPTRTSSTVHAGLGGLIGGAIGSKLGNGKGKYLAGTIGAVLGTVAGNAISQRAGSVDAQEVIIRLSDGRIVAITQAESALFPGQKVYLIGGMYTKMRVIPVTSTQM